MQHPARRRAGRSARHSVAAPDGLGRPSQTTLPSYHVVVRPEAVRVGLDPLDRARDAVAQLVPGGPAGQRGGSAGSEISRSPRSASDGRGRGRARPRAGGRGSLRRSPRCRRSRLRSPCRAAASAGGASTRRGGEEAGDRVRHEREIARGVSEPSRRDRRRAPASEIVGTIARADWYGPNVLNGRTMVIGTS